LKHDPKERTLATYGRIGFYSFKPGSFDSLLDKGRAELPALMEQQPGFLRYAVLRTGPDDIASLSAWETREQSEAAANRLVGWVRENFGENLVSAEGLIGETMYADWSSTQLPKWGRVGVNRIHGSAHDGARAAAEHLMPALKQQPGFCTQTTWRTGSDQVVVFTMFESSAQGAAADEALAPILQEYLAAHVTLERVVSGDVLWVVRKG
jgi:heme-degrading monooxygenase HmoA